MYTLTAIYVLLRIISSIVDSRVVYVAILVSIRLYDVSVVLVPEALDRTSLLYKPLAVLDLTLDHDIFLNNTISYLGYRGIDNEGPVEFPVFDSSF